MTLIAAAISLAISVATYILVASIVEAMKRRGLDPVGRLAGVFAPMQLTEGDEVSS